MSTVPDWISGVEVVPSPRLTEADVLQRMWMVISDRSSLSRAEYEPEFFGYQVKWSSESPPQISWSAMFRPRSEYRGQLGNTGAIVMLCDNTGNIDEDSLSIYDK